MKAIAKVRPEPGVELIETPEPSVRPGEVLIQLEAASVCGTDLHIYQWDAWSASRIKPPRIIGHEFCGTVVALGEGVDERKVGDFISSESHIVCGKCRQCQLGQGHVCVNTTILGVDIDGGFAPLVAVPWQNARPTSRDIPAKIASFQDALGNAVHTTMQGPIEGQKVLITGLGPIGQFAAAVCRACGAETIAGTEISPYRIGIAEQLGMDLILNPKTDDVIAKLKALAPDGFDAILEMSGHPSSLDLAATHVRPGGRISILGVFHENVQPIRLNDLIFKGIDIQCVVGRRLWETWDQMGALLAAGKLNLDPIVTHQMHYTEFSKAMELMQAGEAGKVVFTFA